MGLVIKKKDGKYKIKSSVSDERLHEKKWITEEEVKVVLIERAFWKFIQDAVQIDMDFLAHYHVNDKFVPYPEDKISFNKWWLDNGCKYKPLYEKFKKMYQDLDLDLDMKFEE